MMLEWRRPILLGIKPETTSLCATEKIYIIRNKLCITLILQAGVNVWQHPAVMKTMEEFRVGILAFLYCIKTVILL